MLCMVEGKSHAAVGASCHSTEKRFPQHRRNREPGRGKAKRIETRTVSYARRFQVDALERDALEVHCLVRSLRNSFAPISRIPSDVLSLLPDYYDGEKDDGDSEYGGADYDSYDDEDEKDKAVIALTHVCHRWRDVFVSRTSLWGRLDLRGASKTRTYLQRSRSFPLKLDCRRGWRSLDRRAFAQIIPHVHRLKSLAVLAYTFPRILKHLRRHPPLLEVLDLKITTDESSLLEGALPNINLSSLRELRMGGIVSNFPWKTLENLRAVYIYSPSRPYGVTQLLNLFEAAPLLHTVSLIDAMTDSSDASPDRIVPLPHLKVLTIRGRSPHSVLLRHLRIPTGASLVSEFCFGGDESPLLGYLPEKYPNFSNLSQITSLNLLFHRNKKFALLSGPSGSLRVLAEQKHHRPDEMDHEILRSLGHHLLSTIQRLMVSDYDHKAPNKVEGCSVFQALSSANNLRTLVFSDCDCLPFILALNPKRNRSNLVLCPNIEELILFVTCWDLTRARALFNMAKNRASSGAKLSSITFIDLDGAGKREVVTKLEKHVTQVEFRANVDGDTPVWDRVPGQSGCERV